MTAEYPNTVRKWLEHMAEHGPSNRPFPRSESDLFDSLYPDPLSIKPERAALGAIFGARGYQRARSVLLENWDELSQPSCAGLSDVDMLSEKNETIGNAFTDAMVNGLLEDERAVRSRPNRDPVKQLYRRYHAILDPLAGRGNANYRTYTVDRIGRRIKSPRPVFINVFNGVQAFPGTMDSLLFLAASGYEKEHGEDPDVPKLLASMRSSYDSQIDGFASMHRDDADQLQFLDEFMQTQDGDPMGIHDFKDGTVIFKPDVIETRVAYRALLQESRAVTTRCPFLVPTRFVQPFLDEPADFEVPMFDAFNLHMELLEA